MVRIHVIFCAALVISAYAKDSKASCEPIAAKLTAAQAENAALQKQLTEAKAGNVKMQKELVAAKDAPELNAKLAAAKAENAKLQEELVVAKEASELKAKLKAAQAETLQSQKELVKAKEAPELNAKLAAATAQIAEHQKERNAASEVPYLSTAAIVHSLGSVKNLAFTHVQGKVNFDLGQVYTVATASVEVIQGASSSATVAASKHFTTITKAVLEAADLAKALHAKHVAEHTREYYLTSVESYTVHVEPQLSVAKKAYYETVHPHVGKASEAVHAGIGAAVQSGKALSPKVMDFLNTATASLSQMSNGALGEQLAVITASRTFVVMDRKFNFNHGWFDVVLAAVQSLIAMYVLLICLKFAMKILVWKVGIKMLGKKVCFGLTRPMVKILFRLTRLIFSIACYILFTVIALTFSCLLFAICSGLGVGAMHAIEKNFAAGLSAGLRLGVGAGMGALLYLLLKCTCCKKRKAKHVNGKAVADAKAAPKKAAAATDGKKVGDAKQATKPKKK